MHIVHPVTQEIWDITPLLNLIQQLGASSPATAAEVIYDISRYIMAEQHSSGDTAARLRLMISRLEKLAVAFDSIQVQAAPAASAVMQVVTG